MAIQRRHTSSAAVGFCSPTRNSASPNRLGPFRADLIEQKVNVRIAVPDARNRERNQFGIHHNSAVNFRIGFRQTVLTQQKIPIFPGDFGRDRICSLRGSKIIVRLGCCRPPFRRRPPSQVCNRENEGSVLPRAGNPKWIVEYLRYRNRAAGSAPADTRFRDYPARFALHDPNSPGSDDNP